MYCKFEVASQRKQKFAIRRFQNEKKGVFFVFWLPSARQPILRGTKIVISEQRLSEWAALCVYGRVTVAAICIWLGYTCAG